TWLYVARVAQERYGHPLLRIAPQKGAVAAGGSGVGDLMHPGQPVHGESCRIADAAAVVRYGALLHRLTECGPTDATTDSRLVPTQEVSDRSEQAAVAVNELVRLVHGPAAGCRTAVRHGPAGYDAARVIAPLGVVHAERFEDAAFGEVHEALAA